MPGKEIKGRSKIANYRHGGRTEKQFGGPLTQPLARPGVGQPGVAQPLAQPGVGQPGVARPGVARPGVMPTRPLGLKDGGRTGFKDGTREYPGQYPGKGGKKGIIQKVKEKISRKLRGKELTDVKGIEQDVKTGALTHKAPKDRMDTKPDRWWKRKIATGPHLRRGTKITPPSSSNDMSYKERKKEIKKEKKEEKRKKDWEKKYIKKDK